MPDISWQDQPLPCRDNPDTFFPVEGQDGYWQAVEAKRLCSLCPAKNECLMWALEVGEVYDGIFGGVPPRKRRALRKKMAPALGWDEPRETWQYAYGI